MFIIIFTTEFIFAELKFTSIPIAISSSVMIVSILLILCLFHSGFVSIVSILLAGSFILIGSAWNFDFT